MWACVGWLLVVAAACGIVDALALPDASVWLGMPMSGHEIAQELWGNIAVTQAFLTLSEVIGHADLLVNEGLVREVADGDVIRYEVI